MLFASRVHVPAIYAIGLAFWLGAFTSRTVGTTFGALDGYPYALSLLAVGSGACGALAFLRGGGAYQKSARAALLTVSLVLGAVVGLRSLGPAKPSTEPSELHSGTYRIVGEVRECTPGADDFVTDIEVDEGVALEGDALPGGLLIRVSGREMIVGERVRVLARLRSVTRYVNPGVRHRGRLDVAMVGRLLGDAGLERLAPEPWHRGLLASARRHVRRALTSSLQGEAEGFARAVVLGERRALSRETTEASRGSGVAHVFAVSGLHVLVLCGLLSLAVRALLSSTARCLPAMDVPTWTAAVCAVLAPLVAAFAGGATSAWRAGFMASAVFLLRALGAEASAGRVLVFVSMTFAAWSPTVIDDPAFWLSLGATASLLSIPLVRGSRESPLGASTALASENGWVPESLRAVLLVSTRAYLATLPLVLFYFGRAAPLGVVANVVLTPLAAALLIPLSFIHSGVASLCPVFAGLSAWPLELGVEAFVTAVRVFCWLAPPVDVPLVGPAALVLLIALSLGALFLRSWRGKLLSVVGFALVLVFPHIQGDAIDALRSVSRAGLSDANRERALTVTVLDVGQGDATLLQVDGQLPVLIDTGGASFGGPDPGERSVLPFLRARGIRKLRLVVLTHPHPDHFGGLEAVAAAVHIDEVWTNGQAEDETPGGRYAALISLLHSRGVKVRGPQELCGTTQKRAGIALDVLWPCPSHDPGLAPNDNSFVLRWSHLGRHFLWPGDLEALGEQRLLALGRSLRADVMKVGHHGSQTSTRPEWLAAVRPTFALVSAGAGNRFGHPHDVVLNALENARVCTLRTDVMGGIELRLNGPKGRPGGIALKTGRNRNPVCLPDALLQLQ